MRFLLSHFSPRHKIENCSAQFLAVCWIAHVEFKVHRLRNGFGVSNALMLCQSLPAFIGHNSIRLETERFSKDAICSSLFRCSSRTVRRRTREFVSRVPALMNPIGAKDAAAESDAVSVLVSALRLE